jgi:AraC-like DNA-binding protein
MLHDPKLMLARPARDVRLADGDPLSDVLALLQVRGGKSLRIAAGGAWALRLPAYGYLKFIAQVSGRQWILVDGEREPICLDEGDCLVMHGGRSFIVASDLSVPPVDGVDHFARWTDGATGSVQWGGTADVVAVAGRFDFDPAQRALLSELLPPELHIRAASSAAPALRLLLDMFRHEDAGAPGQQLVVANVARIALVQALRVHGNARAGESGWLAGLGDERIGTVLRCLHADPRRHWSLLELAKAAGMSRSALAARFNRFVGMGPLRYLQRWRMQLAQQALRNEDTPVATLAYRLGYASESAFSATFRQYTGMAPGQFQRRARPDGATPDAA